MRRWVLGDSSRSQEQVTLGRFFDGDRLYVPNRESVDITPPTHHTPPGCYPELSQLTPPGAGRRLGGNAVIEGGGQ